MRLIIFLHCRVLMNLIVIVGVQFMLLIGLMLLPVEITV